MRDDYGPNSRSLGQMDSIMGACLSDHDLTVLVEGSASDDEVSAWKAHIGSSDSCGARLARRQMGLGDDDTGDGKADPDETITVKPGREVGDGRGQRLILRGNGEQPRPGGG